MKAAIYLRVSTTEQAEEGFGLSAQRHQCEAMAIVKSWTVVKTFSDEGISGTKDESEREGLATLLSSAENGDFDAVIIKALDRIGRSTRIVLDIVERLAQHGVEVVSCKESLDTSTPSGRFVLTIFAALAQLERDNIVERTTAGRNARGRVDGEKGGRVPLGYQRGEQNQLVVDPDGAAVFTCIYNMKGLDYSLRKIARKLNSDRIKTARGKQWTHRDIRAVLDNRPKYLGGLRGESTVHWPKILD